MTHCYSKEAAKIFLKNRLLISRMPCGLGRHLGLVEKSFGKVAILQSLKNHCNPVSLHQKIGYRLVSVKFSCC